MGHPLDAREIFQRDLASGHRRPKLISRHVFGMGFASSRREILLDGSLGLNTNLVLAWEVGLSRPFTFSTVASHPVFLG